MATVEVALQDQKGGCHVVVTVRNDGATLPECEDLLTEDVAFRAALQLGHSGPVASRPDVSKSGISGGGLEVDKFEEFGEVDLIRQEILDLLLPGGLRKFLALDCQPDLVDLAEPLLGGEARFPREKVAGAKMLEEGHGEERLDRTPAEVAPGGEDGLLVRIFHDEAESVLPGFRSSLGGRHNERPRARQFAPSAIQRLTRAVSSRESGSPSGGM